MVVRIAFAYTFYKRAELRFCSSFCVVVAICTKPFVNLWLFFHLAFCTQWVYNKDTVKGNTPKKRRNKNDRADGKTD